MHNPQPAIYSSDGPERAASVRRVQAPLECGPTCSEGRFDFLPRNRVCGVRGVDRLVYPVSEPAVYSSEFSCWRTSSRMKSWSNCVPLRSRAFAMLVKASFSGINPEGKGGIVHCRTCHVLHVNCIAIHRAEPFDRKDSREMKLPFSVPPAWSAVTCWTWPSPTSA